MSESRPATVGAIAISVASIVLFCVVLLVRDPKFFWVCDAQLWYSGIYEEIARAWSQGEWPILSAGSWAVPSLAGEYQCGTFSIFFNLSLVLIWKLPLALSGKMAALSIVHLAVLAAGATLLARHRNLSVPAAIMVGMVAALNGWMINWAATDWLVALSGFAWVPWSWWALEVAAASDSRRVRYALPVPFIYLTLSAGSPFAVLMLGVISAWLLLKTWSTAVRIRSILPIVFGWIAGLGLSAPAWLMLIEYYRFSVRGAWPDALQWSWVVPWDAWLGLALPSYTTDWRHFFGTLHPHFCIEMAGGLVPLAAVVACCVRERGRFVREHRWELALLAAAIALVSLPSAGSFRWSFRSMPLVFLVLGLLGGRSMDTIGSKLLANTALGLAGLASAVALLTGRNSSTTFLAIELGFVLTWVLTAQFLRASSLVWGPPMASAAVLLTTYSTLSTRQAVSQHEFRENLLDPAPLDKERLYLGIHSFDDILRGAHTPGWGTVLRPCNTLLCAPLHFLNGYSSFSVRGIPAFFETHGSLQPQTVDALLSPECSELLDLLGVDGLVFGPDYIDRTARLPIEWQLAFASDEGSVFHREPRRFAPAKTLRRIDSRPGERLARPEINILQSGRQRVEVDVLPLTSAASGGSAITIPSLDPARPSAIAFGRPFLPGYRATLNDQPLSVVAYQDYVPLVELPPGASGKLVLSYRPASLQIGLAASASTLLVLLTVAAWPGQRS